jgi:hypothetical protein
MSEKINVSLPIFRINMKHCVFALSNRTSDWIATNG